MSIATNSRTVGDPADGGTTRFAIRLLQPGTAVLTAHGEIDAANAQEFVDYAFCHAEGIKRLVLDLSGVEFFGTAGFTSLHTLNVRCAGESISWASVPSAAVIRLLRICDPDSILPFFDDVDAALAAVHKEPHRLLQLVSQAR
jgi:anti-anti-sigma factor